MSTATEKPVSPPEMALPMPIRTMVILVASLGATWLAAGSLGWLAPPLQKALTWLALATVVIAGLAGQRIARGNGMLLGGGALIAVLMTASLLPVINIVAVAILLAALAYVRPGGTATVSSSVGLAAALLAVFRLACDSSAAVWNFSNAFGHVEGVIARRLTGRPLVIGATFGGLDFLVVMLGLTTAWLIAAPPLRFRRGAWAIAFILLAQTTYLVALAFNQELASILPPQVNAQPTDISHLGIWTWGNAIRSLLPWNLPVLAAVFHTVAAVAMFHLTAWPAAPCNQPEEVEGDFAGKGRYRGFQELPFRPRVGFGLATPWQHFGPAGLLFATALLMAFSLARPSLQGRQVVAYDDGAIDWGTTDPGPSSPGRLPRYGLLPALVESLGGKFVRSRRLADADLQCADVLIVLPSQFASHASAGGPALNEIQQRIWQYVSAGGRLLVAGEPETTPGVEENILNDLLQPTVMSFRDDTANSLTLQWEDNLQLAPQAATASGMLGRNAFSFGRAASVRVAWPAGPLVVGRWAWNELGTDPDRPEALPYSPGDHLGDLVLAAQQNVGHGSVVVLGSAGCLSNDGIPFSYTFTGPLLSMLAAQGTTPLAWWRQLAGLAAAATALVLLFRRFHPLDLVTASLALALGLMVCNLRGDVTAGVRPAGPKSTVRPVIYVDASHLEAMGKDPWNENGVGRLMRVLASNGYLPLLAPDLSGDRLKAAAMLISIAPGKSFTSSEIAAIQEFLAHGGFFLSTVGSPEAEPSRAVLDKLGLHIEPMPIPPWNPVREPEPLGLFWYPSDEQQIAQFFAGWPVFGPPGAETWPKPVIVGNRVESGQAFLIGDTAFALNKNFDGSSPNARFWSAQLKNWVGRLGDKSQAAEPGEGGILHLPNLNADKGKSP
jgi:hypothetical protein